jgi:hypothetical protein
MTDNLRMKDVEDTGDDLFDAAHDIASNTYHGMVELAGRVGTFEGITVADAIAEVAKRVSSTPDDSLAGAVNGLAYAIRNDDSAPLAAEISAGFHAVAQAIREDDGLHEVAEAILELAAAIRGQKRTPGEPKPEIKVSIPMRLSPEEERETRRDAEFSKQGEFQEREGR